MPETANVFDAQAWQFRISEMTRDLPRLGAMLSDDERAKAARFRLERDRDRYVVSRGLLRQLLAGYCDRPAEQLQFAYSKFGKPSLAGPTPGEIHFNVSHSDDAGVIAISRRREVGVDIERVKAIPDADELVNRSFAPEEIETYRNLSADQRPRAFLRGWTRKEAVVKAIGDGLNFPLNELAVTLAPDEPARVIHIRGDSNQAAQWTLMDVFQEPDYMTAFATEEVGLRLSCRRIGDSPEWLSNGQ